jgi:hypothetical protein
LFKINIIYSSNRFYGCAGGLGNENADTTSGSLVHDIVSYAATMDYKHVTINVALLGFISIIFFAVRHKKVSVALHEQRVIASGRHAYSLQLQQSLADSANNTVKVDNVMVVSRIHKGEATAMVDMSKVIKFIEGTLSYASQTFVCVDIGVNFENMDYFNTLKSTIESKTEFSSRARLIPITPWGRFTQALNAAVQRGTDLGMDKIIFQVS